MILYPGDRVSVNLATDVAQRRFPQAVIDRIHGVAGEVLVRQSNGRILIRFDMALRFYSGADVRIDYDFRPEDLVRLP